MDETLVVKVGKISIKHAIVTGGTLDGQEKFNLNQMAIDALVNLIVAIMQGKAK